MRRRIPLSIPAGIWTDTFRFTREWPDPRHSLQTFSGIFPRPSHCVQEVIRINCPNGELVACLIWPEPPQREQVLSFFVSLPDPLQEGQGSVCITSISRSIPATASSSRTWIRIRRSAPGWGPDLRCPPPKKSKISPKPEKSAEKPPPPNPPPPVYEPFDAFV